MPSLSPIIKALAEAADAVKKPQIEMPAKPLVTELPSTRPFPGPPEIKKAVSTTENVTPETTTEKVMGLRRLAESFVRPDPGVSKPVEETMYRGRSRSRAAHDVADLDVADWYSPLKRDPVNQNTLVNWYMTTSDEVAQAERYGKDHVRDIHVDVWKNALDRLQSEVDKDPEVQQAITNIRNGLDEQFNDMSARGWIKQDRYLNDYTPIRRLNATIEAIAGYIGEDPDAMKSRILSAQMKRKGGTAPRETDLPNLLRATRAEYLGKVAEHEAALDLLSDPSVNLTEKYITPEGRIQEDIPSNLRVWRPGPGMFGSTLKSPEGYFLNAGLHSIDPKGVVNTGGFVVPEAVHDAVTHFHPPQLRGIEAQIYKHAMSLMKNLTVHNPKNTNVNRVGDLMTALVFPGEGPAHALGTLKWMGQATRAAYKGAFGREGKVRVKLHGKDVDLWDLAVREGMTSGTIQQHLAGTDQPMPPSLARLYPDIEAAHNNYWEKTKQTLEADRLATEVAPRIAAGLEAVERTGDWSQFGKVGRDITFRYGAGAPRAATFPIVRMMDPFVQYMGLATQRFLTMANAKSAGPKARIMIGLSAIPFAMWSWNTQNDEYKQVEDALAPEERNLPHVIMPSQEDPGKVQRDVDGTPVVLRFKYMVPDQVAQMVGLANLPERVGRVAQGRDKPITFLSDTKDQASKSVGDMLVLPSMLQELVSGKSKLTGKEMTPTDWLGRLMPASRIVTRGIERGQAYGPAEGAKAALTEATGASFAKPKRKGAALLDADLQAAMKDLSEAKRNRNWAIANGTPDQVRTAIDQMKSAAEDVKRIAARMKKEKEEGYSPPPPNVEANTPRIEANREAAGKQ